MARKSILRKALELKETYGRPRTIWFSKIPEDISKRGNSGQHIQKKW
jgi:hypothetical protein